MRITLDIPDGIICGFFNWNYCPNCGAKMDGDSNV